MKVNITIDCTPEEARAFLGLPPLTEFHQMMMEEMRKHMAKGLDPEDMMAFYRQWMPNADAWQSMQNKFWEGFMTAGKDGDQESKE